MTEAQSMLSVGIDVGTTTTQVIFSRLMVTNTARTGQIPRIGITEKKVLYESPITLTPLLDYETIDVTRLTEIIRREYAAAGMDPKEIGTGAVIITGETAKKRNADEILQALGGMAGEFVVTVAGPYLESMIAGRGAGAADYSQKNFCRTTNVDIGGGSANSAVFKSGNLIAAAAMNFGGRILEVERGSGRIRHIAAPAAIVLADIGLRLAVGDSPSLEELSRFADRLADLTVELIEGGASDLARRLYLTPPMATSGRGSVVMFSGGVGRLYYEPIQIRQVADAALYDDVGPLLGESLRRHPGLQAYEVRQPAETLRATVLGASSQTVALSGSTIWAESSILPLRNVPVIRPVLQAADSGSLEGFGERVAGAVSAAVSKWMSAPDSPFAIALDFDLSFDYNTLVEFAKGLAEFANTLPAALPLIVIIQRDYAQSLGQTVKSISPERPLLVIDQVGLEEGDFIDIGTPLMDGRVVPVSIKTLIFYH